MATLTRDDIVNAGNAKQATKKLTRDDIVNAKEEKKKPTRDDITKDKKQTGSQAIKDSLKDVKQSKVGFMGSLRDDVTGFFGSIGDLASYGWTELISNKDTKQGINDYDAYKSYMKKMSETNSEEEYRNLYNKMVNDNIINKTKYEQYKQGIKESETYDFEEAKSADKQTFFDDLENELSTITKNVTNRYQIDSITQGIKQIEKQYSMFYEGVMETYKDTRDDRILAEWDKVRKEYENDIKKFTTDWANNLVNKNLTYKEAYKESLANPSMKEFANGISKIERDMSNKLYRYTIAQNLTDAGDYASGLNLLQTLDQGLLAAKNAITWGVKQVSNLLEEGKQLAGRYDVAEELMNLRVYDEETSGIQKVIGDIGWFGNQLIDSLPSYGPAVIELLLTRKVEGGALKSIDNLLDIWKSKDYVRFGTSLGAYTLKELAMDNLVYDEVFQMFVGHPITNEDENINMLFNIPLDFTQGLLMANAKYFRPSMEASKLAGKEVEKISPAALKLFRLGQGDSIERLAEKWYLLRGLETAEGTKEFKEYAKSELIPLSTIKAEDEKLYKRIIAAQEASTKTRDRLTKYEGNIEDMLLEAENIMSRREVKKLSTIEKVEKGADSVFKRSRIIREAPGALMLGAKVGGNIISKGLKSGLVTPELVKAAVIKNTNIEGMDKLIMGLAQEDADAVRNALIDIAKSKVDLSSGEINTIYNNIVHDLIKDNKELVAVGELVGGIYRKLSSGDYYDIIRGNKLTEREMLEKIRGTKGQVFGSDRVALEDGLDNLVSIFNRLQKDGEVLPEQNVTDMFSSIGDGIFTRMYEKSEAHKAFIAKLLKVNGFKIDTKNGLQILSSAENIKKLYSTIKGLQVKKLGELTAEDVGALELLYAKEFIDSFNAKVTNLGNELSKTGKDNPKYTAKEFGEDYKCWFESMFDVTKHTDDEGKTYKTYHLRNAFADETLSNEFNQLMREGARFKDIEELAAENIIKNVTKEALTSLNEGDKAIYNSIYKALSEGRYVKGYDKELVPVVNSLFNQVKWLKGYGINEEEVATLLGRWFGELVVDTPTLKTLSYINSDFLYKGVISRLILDDDIGALMYEEATKKLLNTIPVNLRDEKIGINELNDRISILGNDIRFKREIEVAKENFDDKISKLDLAISKLEKNKGTNKRKSVSKKIDLLNKEKDTLEKKFKKEYGKYFDKEGILSIQVPTAVSLDKKALLRKMLDYENAGNSKEFLDDAKKIEKRLQTRASKKDRLSADVSKDKIVINDISMSNDDDLRLLADLVAYKSLYKSKMAISGWAKKFADRIYNDLLNLKDSGSKQKILFGINKEISEVPAGAINMELLGEAKIYSSILNPENLFRYVVGSNDEYEQIIKELIEGMKGIEGILGKEGGEYLSLFNALEGYIKYGDTPQEQLTSIIDTISNSALFNKDMIIDRLIETYQAGNKKGLTDNIKYAEQLSDATDKLNYIIDELFATYVLYDMPKELKDKYYTTAKDLWGITHVYDRMKELASSNGTYSADHIRKELNTTFDKAEIQKKNKIIVDNVNYEEVKRTGNITVDSMQAKGSNKKTKVNVTNPTYNLGNKKLVFYDLETTGLKGEDADIIQLSYIVVGEKNGKPTILDTFTDYFSTDKDISKSSKITGITEADLKGKDKFVASEARNNLKALAGDENTILVGHNIKGFDNDMLYRAGVIDDANKTSIDTLKLQKVLYPGDDTWKLENVTKNYPDLEEPLKKLKDDKGISSHDALYDTYASYYLFNYLYGNGLKNGKRTDKSAFNDIIDISEKTIDIKHDRTTLLEGQLFENNESQLARKIEGNLVLSKLDKEFPEGDTVVLEDVLPYIAAKIGTDKAIAIIDGLRRIIPEGAVIDKYKIFIGDNMANEFKKLPSGYNISFEDFALNRTVATVLSTFGLYNDITLKALDKFASKNGEYDMLSRLVETTNEYGKLIGSNNKEGVMEMFNHLIDQGLITANKGTTEYNELITKLEDAIGDDNVIVRQYNNALYNYTLKGDEFSRRSIGFTFNELFNNIFTEDSEFVKYLDKPYDRIELTSEYSRRNIQGVYGGNDFVARSEKQNISEAQKNIEEGYEAYTVRDFVKDVVVSLEKQGYIKKGKAKSVLENLNYLSFVEDYTEILSALRAESITIDGIKEFTSKGSNQFPFYKNILLNIKNTSDSLKATPANYMRNETRCMFYPATNADSDAMLLANTQAKASSFRQYLIEFEGHADEGDEATNIISAEKNLDYEARQKEIEDSINDEQGQDAIVDAMLEGEYSKSKATEEEDLYGDNFSNVEAMRTSRNDIFTEVEIYAGDGLKDGLLRNEGLTYSNLFNIIEDSSSVNKHRGSVYNTAVSIDSRLTDDNKEELLKKLDTLKKQPKGEKKEGEEYLGDALIYNAENYINGEFVQYTAEQYAKLYGLTDMIGKNINMGKGKDGKSLGNGTVKRIKISGSWPEKKWQEKGGLNDVGVFEKGKEHWEANGFEEYLGVDNTNIYNILKGLINLKKNWKRTKVPSIKIEIEAEKEGLDFVKTKTITEGIDTIFKTPLGKDILNYMGMNLSYQDATFDEVMKMVASELYADVIKQSGKKEALDDAYLNIIEYIDKEGNKLEVGPWNGWDDEVFMDCIDLAKGVKREYFNKLPKAEQDKLIKRAKKTLADMGKDDIAIEGLDFTQKSTIDYVFREGALSYKALDEAAKAGGYDNMADLIYKTAGDGNKKGWKDKLGKQIVYDEQFRSEVYSRYGRDTLNMYNTVKDYLGEVSIDAFMDRVLKFEFDVGDEHCIVDGYIPDFELRGYVYDGSLRGASKDIWERPAPYDYEDNGFMRGMTWVSDNDTLQEAMQKVGNIVEGRRSELGDVTVAPIIAPEQIRVRVYNQTTKQHEYGVMKITPGIYSKDSKNATLWQYFPYVDDKRYIDELEGFKSITDYNTERQKIIDKLTELEKQLITDKDIEKAKQEGHKIWEDYNKEKEKDFSSSYGGETDLFKDSTKEVNEKKLKLQNEWDRLDKLNEEEFNKLIDDTKEELSKAKMDYGTSTGMPKSNDVYEGEIVLGEQFGPTLKYDWAHSRFVEALPEGIKKNTVVLNDAIIKDGEIVRELDTFDYSTKKLLNSRTFTNWTNYDFFDSDEVLKQIIGSRINFVTFHGEDLKNATEAFDSLNAIKSMTKDEKKEIYMKIKSAANSYITDGKGDAKELIIDGLPQEMQTALNGICKVFNDGGWHPIYQLASLSKDGFEGMLKNIAHNHYGAAMNYYRKSSKEAVKKELRGIISQYESKEKQIENAVSDLVGDPLGTGKFYSLLTGIRSMWRFIKYGPLFPLTGVMMLANSAIMGTIRYSGEKRGFQALMNHPAFDILIGRKGDKVVVNGKEYVGAGLTDGINRATEIMFNSNSDLGGSWFDKVLDLVVKPLPEGHLKTVVTTALKGGTHSLYDLAAQGSIKSMALAKALVRNGIDEHNIESFLNEYLKGNVSKDVLNSILGDTERIHSRFFTNSSTAFFSRHRFSRWFMFNALQGYVLNRTDEMTSALKNAVNWIYNRQQLAKQYGYKGLGFTRGEFADYLMRDNQELQSFLMNILFSAKIGFYMEKIADNGNTDFENYKNYIVDTSDYLSSLPANFMYSLFMSPFESITDYAEYAQNNYDDFDLGQGLTVAGVKLVSDVTSKIFREGKVLNALMDSVVAYGKYGDIDFSYDVLVKEFEKIANGMGRFQLMEGTNMYGLTYMTEDRDMLGQILFNNDKTSNSGRITSKLQSFSTVDSILNGSGREYFVNNIVAYLPVIGQAIQNGVLGTGFGFTAAKWDELQHIMDKDNTVQRLNNYDIEKDDGSIWYNPEIYSDEAMGRLYTELTAFDYPNKQQTEGGKFKTGYDNTNEPLKEDVFTEEMLDELGWTEKDLEKYLLDGSNGKNKQAGLLKIMAAAEASRPGSSKIVLSYLASLYENNRIKEITNDKYGSWKDLTEQQQNDLQRETVAKYYPYMFVADKTSWYKAITEYISGRYPLFESLKNDDTLQGYVATLGYMDMLMYQQAKDGNVNAGLMKNAWSMATKYMKSEPARMNAIEYVVNSIDTSGLSNGQATSAKMGVFAANMDFYDKIQKNGMMNALHGEDIDKYNNYVWGVLQDINEIGYKTAKSQLENKTSSGFYKRNPYTTQSQLGENNEPMATKFVPQAQKYLNGWTPRSGGGYSRNTPQTYTPGETLDWYRKYYEGLIKTYSDRLVKSTGKKYPAETIEGMTFKTGSNNRGSIKGAKLTFPEHKSKQYRTNVISNLPGSHG